MTSEFPRSRVFLFYGLLLVSFLTLLGRAFELQIIFGQKNRELAEGNRIKKIIKPAPRGIIFDRQQKPLVRNIPVYQKCQKDQCQAISRDEALEIEARGEEGAVGLKVEVGREYLYGPVLAHLLGYLGEANEKEVKQGKYKLGDLVGRTGIEEKYEEQLRGIDGGEIFEVDTRGEKVREMGKIEPIPGQDFQLSIDAELSRVAFEALEGRPGAVVATEAKTGRVLILVSSPSFNPEKLSSEVLSDSSRPMFNRAIAGLYPPGSTFKIVTAVAGLEEGKIDETTTYEDKGLIRIGEYVYQNWYFSQYGKSEGVIDLVKAIKRSTDTFFYKIGEWVGAKKLAEWAKAFGLGRKTGIDLLGEVAGVVPDLESRRWFLGNTYHFAIGQADLLTTPLQVNMITSVIANNGWLCRPRLVDPAFRKNQKTTASSTSDGGPKGLLRGESECRQNLQLKQKTLALIKEGMREACSPGGTAFPFFNFSPKVACKTGTAEFGDPAGRTHAWLTAYAPAGDPEIVVTALVEAGGSGAHIAAPIVKEIMEAWFNR